MANSVSAFSMVIIILLNDNVHTGVLVVVGLSLVVTPLIVSGVNLAVSKGADSITGGIANAIVIV